MNKSGTTSAGRTRWRCPDCGASTTKTRPDITRTAEMRLFIAWLIGPASLSEIAAKIGRHRNTVAQMLSWCWLIVVPNNPADPARVYDQLFIDATYLAGGCVLIARDHHHVVCWHWCWREDKHNYLHLLDKLAPPKLVTTDGHRGSLAALAQRWPDVPVQRCLVHIRRNLRSYTTLHPTSDCGKALRALACALTKVETTEQAAVFAAQLQQFYLVYRRHLSERTYKKDVAADAIPAHAQGNKRWWYTHLNHRRAYFLLERTLKTGQLFAFLRDDLDFCGPDRAVSTTNCLEGATNAPIKELARRHRGLSRQHQRSACDWWLYVHTEDPVVPEVLAKQQGWGADALRLAQANEHGDHLGGPGWGTGVEEGGSMGVQKGWAGRSR